MTENGRTKQAVVTAFIACRPFPDHDRGEPVGASRVTLAEIAVSSDLDIDR